MPGRLDSLQAVATRLINDFGGPATLRSVTRAYSPTTGNVTETVVDTAVNATPPEPFKVSRTGSTTRANDDTAIRESDLNSLVKGDGLSPKAGDRLIKDGEEYQIVGVRPQSAGTVIAFYELHLRN